MLKVKEIFTYDSEAGKCSLGIDENGHLYWNGKAVVTEQRVKLAWWVNMSIIVGGFATLVISVFTALMYFK